MLKDGDGKTRGIDVRTYFTESAPHIPSITRRAINAIIRGGINTMEELCGKSDSELRRVRNMGEKSLELAIAMRDKYAGVIKTHEEEKK